MGIATSLAIGLGVAAAANVGSQIYAAKQQSKAAKKAEEAQVRGTQEAQGYMDSALLPWVNKGRETASTLGRLTAAPTGSRFAAPDPTMPRPPQGQQGPPAGARPNPGGQPPQQQAAPRQDPALTRGTLGGLRQQQGMSQPQMPTMYDEMQRGGSPTMDGGGPPMIALRSPSGEVREVPAHMADQYIQRGAQRVG